MIREDKFLISRRPYAVDLSSYALARHDSDYPGARTTWHGTVNAVWFRRRSGVLAACVGRLWDIQTADPGDVHTFLARHEDGRYGGDCVSRWDGASFWSASQDPETTAAHLELLRPMLENYPDIPAGYDGWYRF